MQHKTTGIVLHTLKYSDSATIAAIYTHQFGRVSYMIYGVNKKRTVCPSALLQPFSILDLDVVHTPGKEIQRIKEVRTAFPFKQIPFHPVKNSIALFLSEVLYRALRQSEPDEELFTFLQQSIEILDNCEEGTENFHLVFLLKLSHYLGCAPNIEKEINGYFDLINGVFLYQRPLHTHYLIPEISKDMLALINSDYQQMTSLSFSRNRKAELLESIIEYYRLHIPDFNGIHSMEVLQSLFD